MNMGKMLHMHWKIFKTDFTPKLPTVKEAASEAEKKVQEMILSQEVKEYVSRQNKYRDNISKAYALILGQCTTGLRNKLEARKDWEDMENKPIKLLKAIKEITHNYQDSRYPIASISKAIKTVMNIHQEEKEPLAVYTKHFRNAVDIMETQHGKFKLSKYIETLHNYWENDPKRCDYQPEQAYERFVAYIYI